MNTKTNELLGIPNDLNYEDDGFAFMMEGYLIPPDDIPNTKGVPKRALEHFEDGVGDGIPTGIAFHEKHGWFVLMSAGQGPGIVWSEKYHDVELKKPFVPSCSIKEGVFCDPEIEVILNS